MNVLQKIKQHQSKRLLKFHGFSVKINTHDFLIVNLMSDLMVTDLARVIEQDFHSTSYLRKLEISLEIAEGIKEL